MNKELKELKQQVKIVFDNLSPHQRNALNLLLDIAFQLGGKDEIKKSMARMEEEFKKF